jgi:hypothetical protein
MSSPGLLLVRRYRLDSRIATGGVGEVWRATDLVLGRPVAVKLLQERYAGHAETLARFRAEAQHAGALSHPGIAQVYDYGEADPPGPPYLVLEVVDGPALAVAGRDMAGPAAAGRVVAQVGRGAGRRGSRSGGTGRLAASRWRLGVAARPVGHPARGRAESLTRPPGGGEPGRPGPAAR